jgi:DNA-3-methyladenine glycosylase
MTSLSRSFFARDCVTVARELLGQVLVHRLNGVRLSGRIVETEAYTGWDDQASHGHRGPTARNAVMFGPAGITYVYFCYGVHWMLNIVAHPTEAEAPAAILLRAIEPLEGLDIMAQRRPGRPPYEWCSGPGRLTSALGIDKDCHALDVTLASAAISFEPGSLQPGEEVVSGPRIGINVPEPSRSRPWRFWLKDNPFISRTH